MKNNIKIIADTIRLVMDTIKDSIPKKLSELKDDLITDEEVINMLATGDIITAITDINGDTFTDLNGDVIVF